ncbi:MAG TPA: anti-sigma factor [Terracidiphilus sp.]|nr:anti-sigma factor [Terracidiphilus sp.]
MTGNAHIPEETLALYALQALDREESAAVRAHLDVCIECRAELASAAGDLALVALSTEQQPLPAGARARFLDRIGAKLKSAGAPVIPIAPAKRKRIWPAWLAAAAMLLLSIGLGIKVRTLTRELHATSHELAEQTVENRHAHEVLDLLTAPKAQHVLLTAGSVPPAPTARTVYLPSRGALVMEASNLKPLPSDKTYELWVIPASGAAPIPAGLFQPDASGSASVIMPDIPWYVPAKAFGVTVEHWGGSATPTTPVILAGLAPGAGE